MKTTITLCALCTVLGLSLASNAWQFARSKQMGEALSTREAQLREADAQLQSVGAKVEKLTAMHGEIVSAAEDAKQKFRLAREATDAAHSAEISVLKDQMATVRELNDKLLDYYNATKASSVARSTPSSTRSTPAPPPAIAPQDRARLDRERIHAAVRSRAEVYYKAENRFGSGSVSITDLKFTLSEPRPVPGWIDRFEVEGSCLAEFYDSRGNSFNTGTGKFTAAVESKGGAARLVDFSPR